MELRGCDPADSPQPLDRERVEEPELIVRRHEEQAIRLRDRARHLGEELRPGDPDGDGRPTRSRTLARSRFAISSGGSASRLIPRTSRNASSIESPSTSGVVSSNTSNTALLALE